MVSENITRYWPKIATFLSHIYATYFGAESTVIPMTFIKHEKTGFQDYAYELIYRPLFSRPEDMHAPSGKFKKIVCNGSKRKRH